MTNFKKLFKEALTPDYLKEDINEATDFNDPALMKARAAQMKRDKIEADEEDKQAYLDKKYGKNFMDKLEAEIVLKQQIGDLKDEREQIMIDMEQEAEPEGGEIADEYGSRLNDIDSRMELIQKDIDDLRMYESVNEEDRATRVDKMMSGEYDDEDYKDSKRYDDVRDEVDEATRQELGMRSPVPKRRAKAALKNPSNDGSKVYGLDKDGKRVELKSINDIDNFKKFEIDADLNEGRSMARFSYADKGSPIKVGDTLYKDGKAGKVIQKLDWKDAFNVEFDDDTMIQVPFTSVEGDKIVREISTTPVSGTKAGVIYSLDNRKYVLTSDVKGARIGDYTNITLPKGTVIYNLPGGLMADHESLRQYAKLSGNIYFDKPTYAGVGIRQMPDILTAIENNSNVIEESLNEELKLGVKYELPTGETGYIMTGGSKDPKDWTFSANKEPYLSVKDKLKPTEKQPGKYDGAFDMGMGKGHHIDEDEEIETSLTPNEIGDEMISKMDYAESKTFDFKKIIKEALTPNYLK